MFNNSTLVIDILKTVWWLVPIGVAFSIIKSPWFKGIVGEALVAIAAKLLLPAETYHPIHNVTLPTDDGSTQIDHIFVSRFGIFVVETKNMKGWIFGSAEQAQWTQKIFKKSFRFQNPLRQNYKHTKTLSAALDINEQHLHSLIVFAGSSTFKTKMPANVTQGGGYIRYIKSFKEAVISEAQVQRAILQIEEGRLSPSLATNRQHVAHLKNKHNVKAERLCPKCSNPMVLRSAKRGANAGNQFWGCSNYPQCKMVQKLA